MGLLALLAEGPTHGYGLKAAFESRTGGVWSLNVGQVYTTLDRLQADGLVEPADLGDPPGRNRSAPAGRDRHTWCITPSGKDALEEWFGAAAFDTAPPRDELLVKVLLAFGRSRSDALAVIDHQRNELYRVAGAHRRDRGRAKRSGGADAGEDGHPLAALAADLMSEAIGARHEADLRWLDHCESVILSLPAGERRQP